jgi:hypothetical protein
MHQPPPEQDKPVQGIADREAKLQHDSFTAEVRL